MSKKNNKNNNKNSQEDSGLYSSYKNDLKNKYQIDENLEKEEIKKVEELETKREDESCIADSIGWNNWKILLRNFFYGIFMGISDGIPGYSGGTTLSIIGFYDDLIRNIKLIFKPDVKKYFWKYLLWFLPFLVAWIAMMLGFSKLVSAASDNQHAIILVFLFGFFALFSIPIFYIKNKQDLPNYKTFFAEVKKKEYKARIKLIFILAGFIILIAFALIARFVPTSTNQFTNETIVGVTFLGDKVINTNTFDSSKVFLWIAGGFLAGFCVLIPGVSGGLVLYMMNIYPEFTYALSTFLSTWDANLIPWIAVIGIGSLLGIISSSMVIDWLIKKWKHYFLCFSLGLVMASFLSIFISLSASDYATLADPFNVGMVVLMLFIAILINAIIFVVLNETHKIDYPKLRFLQKYFKKYQSNKQVN